MLKGVARGLFGSANERSLKRLSMKVEEINAVESELEKLSDDEAKAAWLSYVVAVSLEAKKGYNSEYHPIHAVLGSILDVDVAAMWRPTSENLFDRINKTSCLAALTDIGGRTLEEIIG